MDKRIFALMAIGLLLVTVSFVSAPGKGIEIKDKRDEHIRVIPGEVFCVERTLSSKGNVKATMAPLFSEGATLESIDLKKVTIETYTVDVPEYGTCTIAVSKAMNLSEDECTGQWLAENETCISLTEEEYSCITGYHQEERTREVVSYEPITDGSYEKDKPNKNEKEKNVEKRREKLSEKLKELKHIGHSKEFDLEDEATVRMCFKAPEWDSEITSGKVSYLAYTDSDEDSEGSTWLDYYQYRMPIDCSSVDGGVPIVVNGADDFNLGCGKQIVWTYCSGTTYLFYDSCSDYAVGSVVGDTATRLPMEVELGSGTDYQSADVWNFANPVFVWHLNGDATGSSLGGRDGTETNFDGDEWVTGKFGNAASLSQASSDYIDFTDFDWATSNDWTVMAWVKTTDSDGGSSNYQAGAPVVGDTAGSVRGELGVDESKIYYGYYHDSAGQQVLGTTGISDGSWHFLAWVNSNNNIDLYVDGTLEISGTSGPVDLESKFVARAVGKGYTDYFDGIIDEIRFWNNAFFTADMVYATYHNMMGTAGYGDLGAEESRIGQGGGGAEAVVESDSAGNIVLSPAGSGKVEIMGSLTDGSNDVTVANAKAAYDHIGQDLIKTIGEWQQECSLCVGAGNINKNEIQKRIQNSCGSSQAINSIGVDGGTSCVDVGGSCDCSGYCSLSGCIMTGPLETPQLKMDGRRVMEVYSDTLEINPENSISKVLINSETRIATGNLIISNDIYPTLNASSEFADSSLGISTRWWKEGFIQILHQGDVREYYLENPDYEYEIGTVVAIDPDSEYEIKPLTDVTDRILGVVADLPKDVTEEVCNESTGECYEVTCHLDTDVAIYGKFEPVKVKGTIKTGDYLVASDEEGVVTSMYEKEHPFNKNMFKKSKSKREYNFNAKMFPTLGIAMEDYDSEEVGTIKVVLGK